MRDQGWARLASDSNLKLEDYREIDGIKVPFVLRSEGPVRVVTRLTEIKHNVPIEDTKFKSSPSN